MLKAVVSLCLILSVALSWDEFYRPVASQRKWQSQALEDSVASIKELIADEELQKMFDINFFFTADNLVEKVAEDIFYVDDGLKANEKSSSLRYAPLQVLSYLKVNTSDQDVRNLVKGTLRNVFYLISENKFSSTFDAYNNPMNTKFCLSSYSIPLYVLVKYVELTSDNNFITDQKVLDGLKKIIEISKRQQYMRQYYYSGYSENAEQTLSEGYGPESRWVGFIRSGFRPSEEAMILPFSIPSNILMFYGLQKVKELFNGRSTASNLFGIEDVIPKLKTAIESEAYNDWIDHGDVLAYEADGYGNFYMGDDANLPNLISLSYFDCVPSIISEDLYINTRAKSLSWEENPFYYGIDKFAGLGSLGDLGETKVMSLGIVMQALTSNSDEEIIRCLKNLKLMRSGNLLKWRQSTKIGNVEDVKNHGVASALFGELIVRLSKEKPHILKLNF